MNRTVRNRSAAALCTVALLHLVSATFSRSTARADMPDEHVCANEWGIVARCEHRRVEQNYLCGSRNVYVAVPDGPAPAGGWPVVFFFNGTLKRRINPFDYVLWGAPENELEARPEIMVEIMKDLTEGIPYGDRRVGQEFAVVAPDAATIIPNTPQLEFASIFPTIGEHIDSMFSSGMLAREATFPTLDGGLLSANDIANNGLYAWGTNLFPIGYDDAQTYAAKCDRYFHEALFDTLESSNGVYGATETDAQGHLKEYRFDMNRRYAFGISSGGYNTSRMALSFNDDGKFKALAILSASYATCAGPICSDVAAEDLTPWDILFGEWPTDNFAPGIPENHPPTKFWQGEADEVVPAATARLYYDRLRDAGRLPVGEDLEYTAFQGGHRFDRSETGWLGVAAWFMRHL